MARAVITSANTTSSRGRLSGEAAPPTIITSGPATASKVQMAAEYYPEGKFYGGEAAHAKAPQYALTPAKPGK